MAQPGDYERGSGPGYTRAAGFGQQQGPNPRTRLPATPPQFQREAPPREDPRPAPQYTPRPAPQPGFTPGDRPPQQPRGQYPPPQPAWQPQQQAWQQPYPPQYAPQPFRQRRSHVARNVLAGIGGVIVFIIVISLAANSGRSAKTADSSQAAPPATTAAASPATTAAAAGAVSSAPKSAPASSAPAPAPANAKPAGTVSELQALTTAEGYLSDGQGFSRQGLIDQLDSSFGNGFSAADATWGVEHSDANWDAQAVDCAKGYMSDGQGFSRSGLIQQMTSAYGNKFTEAQAEYAANAVGL